MKQILLIATLILGLTSFSMADTQSKPVEQPQTVKSEKGKSPYTLEEIEAFLREVYGKSLERNAKIRRWEVPEVTYFITGPQEAKPTEEQLKELRRRFEEISKITGIKVQEAPALKGSNIVIVFSNDVYETAQMPNMRKILFGNMGDDKVKSLIDNFRRNGTKTLSSTIKKNGNLKSLYILTDSNITNYSENYSFVLRTFLLDASFVKDAEKNIQSFFSKDGAYILHSIDFFHLESLYGKNISSKMSIVQSIPIMAKEIHNKFEMEATK